MFEQSNILKVKEICIAQYLESLNFRPVQTVGEQYLYKSPFQDEKTPSFFVHPSKNVWNDFSSNDRGDIIRLVRKIHNCSFAAAIQILEDYKGKQAENSFFFSGNKLPISQSSGIEITKIKTVENKALLQYLQSRCISYDIAIKYIQEAYYLLNGKPRKNGMPYFALVFLNDKGGYELRRDKFQSCTSPKWFTSIIIEGSTQVNLFEGIFDFLSALEYYRMYAPTYTTIILNSLSFLPDVIPLLKTYSKINSYMDNDKAGNEALIELRNSNLNIVNRSTIYADYKDFNDFLQAKKTHSRKE